MSTSVVVDSHGAEVVRWVGTAGVVAPLVTQGQDGQYVELWADGAMVQRSQLGNRDPASLRFVQA